ncbi:MAG: glycosyltransferase [Myxococcota bacterium]|nr:glycosyltransferase [Myxococcota bacterium]
MDSHDRNTQEPRTGATHRAGDGKISVIIPVRNGEATIGRTLRSLVPDQGLIGKIVVVDDDSRDATAPVARQVGEASNLPLEILATRAGSPGAARNAGLRRITGDFIFWLDADDEVIAGGLGRLHGALSCNPSAGLAIGASIRRTQGRPDKLKVPSGYDRGARETVRQYLTNGMWPIAIGSALLRTSAASETCFPTSAILDEDTVYWAAILSRVGVAVIPDPVLLYHHDELRMARRLTEAPKRTLLAISRELNELARWGVDKDVLQWRKAWIAQRMARQLIKHGRFVAAGEMLRGVRADPDFFWYWKSFQYSLRVGWNDARPKRRRGRNEQGKGAASPPKGRVRTLVLTADPALPPISGAELRNWQNGMAATRLGPVLMVSLHPLHRETAPTEGSLRLAALTTTGDARSRALARRRTRIDLRIPLLAARRLTVMLDEFQPDVVIVEGLTLFPLLEHLRPRARRLILDMHNVESDLSRQLDRAGKARPWHSRLGASEATRLLGMERRAMRIADRVWVCSDADESRLRQRIDVRAPIDVVPNGIPRFSVSPEITPPTPDESGCSRILFIGHLGYAPNVDAAVRLCSDVLPRIHERLPASELVIAGRSPAMTVRALARLPGVQLVADPKEIPPLLRWAHVTAVPLRSGGGTRFKILEAMAWGVPVVASSLAIEGLPLVDGRDVLVAEEPADFAERIVSLCTDPRKWEAQRTFAREKALRLFGRAVVEHAVRNGLGLRHDSPDRGALPVAPAARASDAPGGPA